MSQYFCSVVGDPIEHSLSPVIHERAYSILGLDWQYHKQRVSQGKLGEYLLAVNVQGSGWKGSCVTMPLKVQAAQFADYSDGLVKMTGVANTLVPTPVGLAAFNTDVRGIVDALKDSGQHLAGRDVLILGAGATASSALAAVQEIGVSSISIVSRRIGGPHSAQGAAARMGLQVDSYTWQMSGVLPRVFARASLVISTLPSSVQCDIPLPALSPGAVCLEVPYDPWPTIFARKWLDDGLQVVPGWKMLLHQGVAQVKLFSSHEVCASDIEQELKSALEIQNTQGNNDNQDSQKNKAT